MNGTQIGTVNNISGNAKQKSEFLEGRNIEKKSEWESRKVDRR